MAGSKTDTCELHFRAPRKNAADLPWKGLPDKAFKEWVGLDAAKVDPAVELVKPVN